MVTEVTDGAAEVEVRNGSVFGGVTGPFCAGIDAGVVKGAADATLVALFEVSTSSPPSEY